MKIVSLLLVICLAIFAEVQGQRPYKLCSLNKDHDDCDQLQRSEDVVCRNNKHHVDCILNIEQATADFGRITAEEAVLAAKFVNNIVVLGDFRTDSIYEDSEYGTVVLVRSDHTNGLKGLRGKKYCHPGFEFNEVVTELFLKEFENTVLKENNAQGCANTVESNTVLEKELKALSEFFGPSCRQGPWVGLEQFDNKFYEKYPRLCELCVGNNNNKCILQSAAVPFTQSLDCLVNGGGEVSLTTLNTVFDFFNRTENVNKKADYRFLCKNGDINTLDRICTWSRQPLNLVITNRDKAGALRTEIESWLPKNVITPGPVPFSSASEKYEGNLKSIFFPADKQYNKISFLSAPVPLKEYVERFRTIPDKTSSEKCSQNLKWCTISNEEQQKCEWLAQASLNRAIQPVLSCVQSESTNNLNLTILNCLEDLKNDKADIVTSDAHYGYIARKKNLAPLAYPETDSKNRIKPIVVVKDNSELKGFQNLKTKSACFPEYGGIEWLAFINTAREHSVMSKTTCDFGELISDFVGDSCMPGAHDGEHEKSVKANEDKLCSLCVPNPAESKTAKTCNTGKENKYYGNVGALKCLKEAGDFAVITKGAYPEVDTSGFRVLCKNGSLAAYTGLDVDENCVLTDVINSEVVSKRNSPKNADLSIVLLNFETRFGTDRVKAFEVFNIFNGTLDLLFKDSTPGLAPVSSSNNQIKNYVNLFAQVDKCTENTNDGGGGSALRTTVLPLIVTFILLKFY